VAVPHRDGRRRVAEHPGDLEEWYAGLHEPGRARVPQVVRSGVLDARELPRAMPRAVEGVIIKLPTGRTAEDEIAWSSGTLWSKRW
jgi:hypothetical protein